MIKLVIFVLFLGALYVLWRLVAKHKINSVFNEQSQELSSLIQTPDQEELPEKTKMIKQMIDEERKKTSLESVEKVAVQDEVSQGKEVLDVIVTDEDQRLFDDAAQLFFSQAIQNKDFNQSEQIQKDILSKMPMNTQSQIGSFDFGEWSIFWNYHDQSLEYYVGRYGVFYAHVDREGKEHKAEFKERI